MKFRKLKEYLLSPLFLNSGIYVAASFLGPGIAFLLMPVFTRYLSPEDYGLVSMFTILVGIVGSMIGMGTKSSVARKYVEKDTLDFPVYFSNCLLLLLIATGVASAIIWLLRSSICHYAHFPASWLWVVVLFAVAQRIILLVKRLIQMQERAFFYASLSAAEVVIPAVVAIVFVVGFGMDWEGRIIPRVLISILLMCSSILYFHRTGYLRFAYNKEYLRHAIRFGLPLIPHALGMYLISMTDRLLIVNMVGLEKLGVYSVGAQVGMLMGMCQTGFNQAWVPVFYKKLKMKSAQIDRKVVKFIYLYSLLLFLVAVALGLLSIPLLKFVVGERFKGAGVFVIWIALGYAFNGMYKMFTNFIFYTERTHLVAIMTGVTSMLNVLFSYVLIRAFGAIGAAQGTMLAYFISFVGTAVIATRAYKMPWSLRKNEGYDDE